MSVDLLAPYRKTIDELRTFILEANAVRASQLLIDTCAQTPLLAGVVTLLRNGSIDDAIKNIASFNPELAAELREHREVVQTIGRELSKPCRVCRRPRGAHQQFHPFLA